MTTSHEKSSRPPVLVVLGHVDHGKSSLLDYVRKSNIVAGEAGGITQHTAAYEVVHKDSSKKDQKITFIDTPGHEAFGAQRKRGAALADIAVLVVSAEDGVKAQTKDALSAIIASNIPYIVAINKIDLPAANVERTLGTLLENEIYVEGRGGTVPFVPISAKTGEGVPELLDMVLLLAEVNQYTGEAKKLAEGIIVESHRDPKRGISATFIIREGTLDVGMAVASSGAYAPVRSILDHTGVQLKTATMCAPVTVVGWSALPSVGEIVVSFEKKKDAESYADEHRISPVAQTAASEDADMAILPIIIKADVMGSLDALRHEINKIKDDRLTIKIISADVGAIGENDIKRAGGDARTVILGFNTSIEDSTREQAERAGIEIHTETIIYKLGEWLTELMQTRRPKQMEEVVHGKAKLLRIFSKLRTKQVIGARVDDGAIGLGDTVTILRRGEPIGHGKIIELQKNRNNVKEVEQGSEFGAKIDSSVEVAVGDELSAFTHIEQ
ncbi:MAG: translation initiation factor IF-2 [Patescibacteria group bacterium]